MFYKLGLIYRSHLMKEIKYKCFNAWDNGAQF